ncbi:MAG: hypothetical protein FWG94_13065 [Oscillospiraceae bacterium]|nr:hypothetical protein [Oscillospiraceae bacterium]
MSKDEKILLKPALLGGFKRKAVLSYIFELNEATRDTEKNLSAQIEDLTKARDILSENLKEMGQKLSDAQNELQAANNQLSEQGIQLSKQGEESGAQVKSLKAEIDRLNRIIAQKDGDISRHISINEDLEKQNKELSKKNQTFSEKRAQLELASSQITDLMDRAKSEAVKIVEQAKTSAAKITAGAARNADEIIENAKISAKKHIADTHRKMEDSYKQFDVFQTELNGLKQTVADTVSTLTEKMDSLHHAASSTRAKAPDKAFSVEAPDNREAAAEDLPQVEIQKDDSGFFRLAAEE